MFNKNIKSNKSQIFLFDLIFSIIILIVSFTIVYSYSSSSNSNSYIYSLNQDIINSLTNVKLSSLNDNLFSILFKEGLIINSNDLISTEIIYLINSNKLNLARNLTNIFLNNYNLKGYNINISLINSTNNYILYNSTSTLNIKFKNSILSSSISRNIIYFNYYNDSYQNFILNIKIWN